jgi:hypothetical protein
MNQATMAAEIAAMEKESYGNPEGEELLAADDASVELEAEVESEPIEEVIVDPAEAEGEPGDAPPTDPPDEVVSMKRFANFKAASDATIHGLRTQAVQFQEDMVKMQNIIQTLTEQLNAATAKKDPYDGLFTPEEKDLIGEETLAAMAKANKAALDSRIKPLQDQLEQQKKQSQNQRDADLARQKRELSESFFGKLESLVPNFRKTDTNLGFLQWMKEADAASGYPREVIFKRAQANGDVGRCAEFMLQYRALLAPKDKLAGKTTPTSSASGKRPVPKKPTTPQITPAFIDKFYQDAIRGKYKGKEKERQAIEKLIDDHVRKLSNPQ